MALKWKYYRKFLIFWRPTQNDLLSKIGLRAIGWEMLCKRIIGSQEIKKRHVSDYTYIRHKEMTDFIESFYRFITILFYTLLRFTNWNGVVIKKLIWEWNRYIKTS